MRTQEYYTFAAHEIRRCFNFVNILLFVTDENTISLRFNFEIYLPKLGVALNCTNLLF